VKVEIWSDVACPWCYIGKRRFEVALSRFEHRDQVHVRWRSFELDPDAPAVREDVYAERLATKYGITVHEAEATIDRMIEAGAAHGVVLRFDKARPANTFDAHRLLHLAARHDVQHDLKERLLHAMFTSGATLTDVEVVVALAADGGLDPVATRDVLTGDAFAADVRADERLAAELGITSVPFFVVDGTFGVSGAQPPELLLGALEEAWADAHPASGDEAAAAQSS